MYIQWNISHKMEKFESDVVRWMNLEPVIQSEVSQKEKNKCCILKHIYGIQKHDIEEFICRATMAIQTQRIDLCTWGEERVRCMETVTWKLILPYVKQIANRNLLYG